MNLLKDGIKYFPYKYKNEDEIERMFIEHTEDIFGENSIFLAKHKIKTNSGIGTVPDGFLLLIEDKKWYVIEMELAEHPLHEHIVVQISKFNSAIKNPINRNKLVELFYEEINNNMQLKYEFEYKGITEDLHKFLSDVINIDPEIIIVIDETNNELVEVCDSLPFLATVLEFKTYYREKIGLGVHIHFFDTLKNYRKKELAKSFKKGEPQGIIYSPGKMIKIVLKKLHTPIKHNLIRFRKQDRNFFPGYKIPFILETDIGEITTKITSRSNKEAKVGDLQAGSYICGGLKPWYDKHEELKEGDTLIIEVIESQKRYKLYVGK